MTYNKNLSIKSANVASISGSHIELTGSVYITGSTVTLTGGSFNGNGSNLTNIDAGNISAGTLTVARGGTGQTSYTDGQLLIGNSTGNTLSKATLTQGTGITITNGAGSITVGLTNNSVTIGSTSVSLGSSATTLAGLTSVTSTGFTGSLNGNADTTTNATNVAATETTTDSTYYIPFMDGYTTANRAIRSDSGITYNPSSDTLNVGILTATAKSFDIEHPTKEGMRLRYGSLEGPENGVYVRGMTTEPIIELPEHWTGLVDEETITVNLTPYGTSQQLWVKKIEDNKVYIGGKLTKCYFTVFGERKDVEKLVVEY